MRYYIYDANGVKFGNHKGYTTHAIAQGICTRKRNILWQIYDDAKANGKTDNLIYSVKLK